MMPKIPKNHSYEWRYDDCGEGCGDSSHGAGLGRAWTATATKVRHSLLLR